MFTKQKNLMNHLKESLMKLSNDKQIQSEMFKNVVNIVEKLTPNVLFKKIFSYPLTQQDLYENDVNKLTIKNELLKNKSIKWKNFPPVSASTIFCQTQHSISEIKTAENTVALINRLDVLIKHLKQYPEARKSTIEIGGIRLLLKLRLKYKNDFNVLEPVNVALALLGYTDPVKQSGIRILSIDGGGIRGLIVLEMLKKLEELTGKHIYELFDLICGVSTGAILSFSLGIHFKSPKQIAEIYKDISNEVFQQSAIKGTGNLVWSQAYYDTSLWEKKLQYYLGDMSLIHTVKNSKCPKLLAVSAIVNQSHLSAYLFRNYVLPWKVKSQYFGNCTHKVWEAVRASAAAPTYFGEFKLGNFLHQDGGILVNNPTAVALHEAKLIWPNTPIQCVVSFGTGRTVSTFNDTNDYLKNDDKTTTATSWTNKFYKILDSATDTEGVHIMLNDLLPENVYYRFNPYLTEMLSMVEISPIKLEILERDALMYLRKNESKFQQAAKQLMEKKSLIQKTKDFFNYQRIYYGI